MLIQGVSKPEAKQGATETVPVTLPVGWFQDMRESGELLWDDLPNDQEALVERNGCKVEHRREDGLHEGGSGCHCVTAQALSTERHVSIILLL